MSDDVGIVLKEVCEEKHKSVLHNQNHVENVLVDHGVRLKTMEELLIKVTALLEGLKRNDFWNKVMVLCMGIMCIVMLIIMFGVEQTSNIIDKVIK